jgi:O-antigen ligase
VVGCDLRLVEEVTGRLDWRRALVGGLAIGVWIGGFVGLLMAIWTDSTSDGLRVILGSAGYGAIFGAIFALAAYALTRGRHDYVSRSQIVPRKYELLADADYAERARGTLTDLH